MKKSAKNIILFIVSLLFGLLFINAGVTKFYNYMPTPAKIPENMQAFYGALMQIKWLLPLVGVAEIVGGILIIIPRYRALGAIIIFPVMVGIVLTSLSLSSGLILPLVLSAILIWIMIENREKYLPMIR